MLIALLTLLLLGQGSGTSTLLEDLGYMEKAIQRNVENAEVRAEALARIGEIRELSEQYNRQRAETIAAFVGSNNPFAKPTGDLLVQLEDFEQATRAGQAEMISLFLELRSTLTREQWQAVMVPEKRAK